nr:lipopolysaccharide biosynthesis protein [Breznakibacter sp.]
MENKPIIQNDEIDLIQLFKTIWAGRKIIYLTVALFFIIGIVVAVTSPVKYKASATLLPSSEKKGGSLGGLSSLAGLAGINLGGLDASGIDPSLYPQIVESTPFKMELIKQKFDFEGFSEPVSFLEVVSKKQPESFGSLLLKYTIKLPFTIKDALSSKPSTVSGGSKKYAVAVEEFSTGEQQAIQHVSKIVKITVDSKGGLVTVEVELGQATLTAEVTAKVVELLQRYVIDYKTKQVRDKLAFIEKNYEEKRSDFERAQKALLNYRDQNRNVVSERVNIDYQRLSDAYDLSSTVYKGVAQQYEQVKLQVKEETPVFSVIEPVQM